MDKNCSQCVGNNNARVLDDSAKNLPTNIICGSPACRVMLLRNNPELAPFAVLANPLTEVQADVPATLAPVSGSVYLFCDKDKALRETVKQAGGEVKTELARLPKPKELKQSLSTVARVLPTKVPLAPLATMARRAKRRQLNAALKSIVAVVSNWNRSFDVAPQAEPPSNSRRYPTYSNKKDVARCQKWVEEHHLPEEYFWHMARSDLCVAEIQSWNRDVRARRAPEADRYDALTFNPRAGPYYANGDEVECYSKRFDKVLPILMRDFELENIRDLHLWKTRPDRERLEFALNVVFMLIWPVYRPISAVMMMDQVRARSWAITSALVTLMEAHTPITVEAVDSLVDPFMCAWERWHPALACIYDELARKEEIKLYHMFHVAYDLSPLMRVRITACPNTVGELIELPEAQGVFSSKVDCEAKLVQDSKSVSSWVMSWLDGPMAWLKSSFGCAWQSVTGLCDSIVDWFSKKVLKSLGLPQVSKTVWLLIGIVVLLIVVALCTTIGVLTAKAVNAIMNTVVEAATAVNDDPVVPQGLDSSQPLSYLCGVASAISTGEKASVLRSFANTLKSVDTVVSIAKKPIMWVWELLNSIPYVSDLLARPSEDCIALKWLTDVNTALSVCDDPRCVNNPTSFSVLLDLIKQYESNMKVFAKSSLRSSVAVAFKTLYNRRMAMKRAMAGQTVRAQPGCVWFVGPPGMGKTTTMSCLQGAMVDVSILNREVHDYTVFTYAKTADGFWNGFNEAAHDIIVMDEMGGMKEPIFSEVWSSFLTLVSNGEFRPNIASINAADGATKNSIARPTLVFLGSNEVETKYGDPDAVLRRVNWFVEPMPRCLHLDDASLMNVGDVVTTARLDELLIKSDDGRYRGPPLETAWNETFENPVMLCTTQNDPVAKAYWFEPLEGGDWKLVSKRAATMQELTSAYRYEVYSMRRPKGGIEVHNRHEVDYPGLVELLTEVRLAVIHEQMMIESYKDGSKFDFEAEREKNFRAIMCGRNPAALPIAQGFKKVEKIAKNVLGKIRTKRPSLKKKQTTSVMTRAVKDGDVNVSLNETLDATVFSTTNPLGMTPVNDVVHLSSLQLVDLILEGPVSVGKKAYNITRPKVDRIPSEPVQNFLYEMQDAARKQLQSAKQWKPRTEGDVQAVLLTPLEKEELEQLYGSALADAMVVYLGALNASSADLGERVQHYVAVYEDGFSIVDSEAHHIFIKDGQGMRLPAPCSSYCYRDWEAWKEPWGMIVAAQPAPLSPLAKFRRSEHWDVAKWQPGESGFQLDDISFENWKNLVAHSYLPHPAVYGPAFPYYAAYCASLRESQLATFCDILTPIKCPDAPYTVREMASKVKDTIVSHWKGIAAVSVSLAVAVFVVYKGLARLFCKDDVEAAETEIDMQGKKQDDDSGYPPKNRRFKPRKRELQDSWTYYEPDFGVNWAQSRDVRSMFVELEVNGVPATGWMPLDRIVLTYSHVWPTDTETVKVKLNGTEFEVAKQETLGWGSKDLIAFKAPNTVNARPNITSMFLSDEELNNMGQFRCERIGTTDRATNMIGTPCASADYNVRGMPRTLQDVFTYNGVTHAGDCGDAVVISVGPYAGRVAGMHVAGNASTTRPLAIAQFVVREMIYAAAKRFGIPYTEKGGASVNVQGLSQEIAAEILDLPNVERVDVVSSDFTVNLPRESRYVRTVFAEDPDLPHEQQPSLLRKDPVLSDGRDPAVAALKRIAEVDSPVIDERSLPRIQEEIIDHLEGVFQRQNTFKWRELTVEEAIAGIPGYMNPINLASSAGWPHVLNSRLRGKYDFVERSGDSYKPTESFRAEVLDLVRAMKEGDMEFINSYQFRWVAYLKDEMRDNEKIKVNKTRMIFCNSAQFIVAARIMFGSVLIAFNHCNCDGISAIGMNMCSYDAQELYSYLTERGYTKFIAGDYSSFDLNYHPVVQTYSYGVLEHFARKIEGFSQTAWNLFVQHETTPIVQISDALVTFKHCHLSGNFFTTQENIIQNCMYFMYVFYLHYPGRVFFECVIPSFLGDDHILSVCDDVPEFNAKQICEDMKRLGQKYTDDKKEIPTYEYRSFDESTYLGCSFRKIEGAYVGLLREKTLLNHLDYAGSSETLDVIVDTFLNYMSLYPEDKFNSYLGIIRRYIPEAKGLYHSRQQLQANTYTCYRPLVAQGPRMADATSTASPGEQLADSIIDDVVGERERNVTSGDVEEVVDDATQEPVPVRKVYPGDKEVLTKVNAVYDTSSQYVPEYNPGQLSTRALNAGEADLAMGADAEALVSTFSWSSTDTQGKELFSLALPSGALRSAELTTAMMTMPFRYMTYWRGDMEIEFHSTTSQFTSGALIVYWMPLVSTATEFPNMTVAPHVFLNADAGGIAKLKVPYQYPTSVVNTYDVVNSTLGLGTVHVAVFAPLNVSTTTSDITVSVYFRCVNSHFYCPREPFTIESIVAQGRGSGKSGMCSVGQIADQTMLGSVVHHAVRRANNLLEHTYLPLDDTPVRGGTSPMQPQFATASGAAPHPGQSFQLNDRVLYSQHTLAFDPAETKIDFLCGKECVVQTFAWSSTDAKGKTLLKMNLDSVLGVSPSDTAPFPMNLAVLNQFQFWHCDFEFALYVWKTSYHSGRLRVFMDYSGQGSSGNHVYNQPLDFTQRQTIAYWMVPWNCATEFLRTGYAYGKGTSRSIGTMKLEVVNKLVTNSDIVAPTINCVLTVRCVNVRVAVPMAVSPCVFDNKVGKVASKPATSTASVTDVELVAQGAEEVSANAVPSRSAVMSITGTHGDNSQVQQEALGEEPSRQFGHIVKDVMEVYRRAYMRPVGVTTYTVTDRQVNSPKVGLVLTAVAPPGPFDALYAGFAGSIRYRVFCQNGLWAAYLNSFDDVDDLLPILWGNSLTINQRVYNYSGEAGRPAFEFLAPLGNGSSAYVDVDVPYQSEFVYQCGSVGAYSGGAVFLQSAMTATPSSQVYAAAGDDAQFGVFHAPRYCRYGSFGGSKITLGGLKFSS
uniref:Genome polyprotein n=1 Tax=Husavirus XZ112_XZ_CHN_2017 TaxID=2778246 RepID=A0A7L8Y1Y3_9VIRU|nr:polyprotein [Husavirus XZ112_XZ_CHN_2017]